MIVKIYKQIPHTHWKGMGIQTLQLTRPDCSSSKSWRQLNWQWLLRQHERYLSGMHAWCCSAASKAGPENYFFNSVAPGQVDWKCTCPTSIFTCPTNFHMIQNYHLFLNLLKCIHFKILLITWNLLMIWHQNICVNWCPLESHPENSDHPVRYYCRCQCLGSNHMVIVHLILQPPLCWIDCLQILEMCRLLKI